jgi:hypothetical protein
LHRICGRRFPKFALGAHYLCGILESPPVSRPVFKRLTVHVANGILNGAAPPPTTRTHQAKNTYGKAKGAAGAAVGTMARARSFGAGRSRHQHRR